MIRSHKNLFFPIRSFVFITFILLCSLECAKHINISIMGTHDLNSGGHTIKYRICQLKSDVKFNQVSRETFWSKEITDADVLGKDFVENSEIVEVTLRPNEIQYKEIKIAKATNFIGIAANFNDPNSEKWRHIFPVVYYSKNKITVVLGENALAISGKKIEELIK